MSKKRFFMIALLIVLSVCLVFVVVDYLIGEIVINSAKRAAEIKANEIINNEVNNYLDSNNLSYTDFVKISSDNEGNVKSVESKVVTINKIKSELNSQIIKKIKSFENGEFNIKLGTLLGSDLLSGVGPQINFNYDMMGSVNSQFKERFVDAGINQIKHKISVVITADLYVIMPLKSIPTTTETEIILSETVIVGNVPNTYIGF